MVGLVAPNASKFFINTLQNKNWTVKQLNGTQFQIGDYIILRLSKADFYETKSTNTLEKKITKLACHPLNPIVIIEGEITFSRQSKKTFSLTKSSLKYNNYIKILKIAIKDYKFQVIHSLDKMMTVQLLQELQQKTQIELDIDFLTFDSQIPDLSNKRFFRLVTYLSANFGKPFEELSKEEIKEGLKSVKIPGFGKVTRKKLLERLTTEAFTV